VNKSDIRILGIDTSLRSTGVGVVAAAGSRMSAVEYGAIRIPARAPLSECLKRLNRGIVEIIERTRPEAVAIEGVFFSKNANTAVILGEARGVVIAACAFQGLPIYEYAPRRVKQAVVGFGAAEKEQVRKMVMSLLGLKEDPQEDAGDALALAICHIHSRTGIAALMPEPI
jgi:crossover junction endodeoxyribonuclease RuvC